MADTHTYKFNVSMSCSGCSGAVDRVLKKLDGKQLPIRTQSERSHPSVSPLCSASQAERNDTYCFAEE